MRYLVILLLIWQGFVAHADEASYYTMKKVAYRYFEGGKSAKAVRYVQAFIEKHPESYRAQNLLAHFYYWEGKKEQSRRILEKVVQKSDLAEAKRLLKRLQKISVSKKRQKGKSAKQSAFTKSEDLSSDLAFLLEYVQTHPFEIENRKFLMHYFISTNDTKAAQKMAQEILRIDPDESETQRLAKKMGWLSKTFLPHNVISLPKMKKIVSVLHKDFAAHKYHRFINLYKALLDQNASLPKSVHFDAVEAAVEIKAFALARKILQQYDFTQEKDVRELRAMLDRKALHSVSGKQSIL